MTTSLVRRRLPQIPLEFLFGIAQAFKRPLAPEGFLGLLTLVITSFMLDAFLHVPISVLLNLLLPLDGDVLSLVQPDIGLILISVAQGPQDRPLLLELLLQVPLLPLQARKRKTSRSALLQLLIPDDTLR